MSQPIRGAVVTTPTKRPDMKQTDPKKSDYIKNNPLAGLTGADNGKVLSVVNGEAAFVEDHTLENAEKYTDEQIEATKEAIGKEVDERCQGLENGGVAKIKTTNGQMLTIFVGTHAEYEAYVAVNGTNGLFALITDDTTRQDLDNALRRLEEKDTMLQEEISRNYAMIQGITKAPTKLNGKLTSAGYYYFYVSVVGGDNKTYTNSFGLVYWGPGDNLSKSDSNMSLNIAADGTCSLTNASGGTPNGRTIYVNKLEVTA